MISIRIQNLTKRFGAVTAVQQLDLTIGGGELFFLLGPSGCGKTTLLRCLAGFYIPDEGKIYFGDEDVTRLAPHKRNTGMMFQSYALWPHMTVAENVAFGLEQRKVSKDDIRKRVGEALESVRMGEYAGRKPNELSGGQQQRVALARALVLEPAVLLFDEPLSNLDARLRREMREEIRSLQQRLGLTVAYVTHDQSEALAVSDQIIVMDDGRIAQSGSPQDLYERPDTEFVAGFMGEAMLFPATAAADGSVQLGPLRIVPAQRLAAGAVKVAVRPEAWQIHRAGSSGGAALAGTLLKSAYLGSLFEYTFETALGKVFVVSPELTDVLPLGAEVALTLAEHGVSVVKVSTTAR